jgi:hypothetical protein
VALGELDELIREILQHPWDYPEELVWRTPGDAVAVLQRFLAGDPQCDRM